MERAYQLAFEDEEEEEEIHLRRPRWVRERRNPFYDFDEVDFRKRFRLSKRVVLFLVSKIEHELEFPTDRNNAVSPVNQLLCTLRYFATGCYQMTAGDLGGFSTSTANRIVHRVSRALAGLKGEYIRFPETEEDMRKTKLGFFNIAAFPNVIGAIDCTHIRYTKSPGVDAEIFRNRKGYFSLNVQAICNSNLEFIDIVARWRGSTHDSRIFNCCYRKAMFEQGRYGNGVLVGDSGYACTRYMMTPLATCNSASENLYNESQIRTRNPIERMFGVWKKRFPALAIGFGVTVQNSFAMIIATAVLHNLARQAGEDLPPNDPELLLPLPWEELLELGNIQEDINDGQHGRREPLEHRHRRGLIGGYFERLARQP